MYIVRANRRNGIKDFVCDTEADLETLPSCQIGSSSFVIEGSKRFIQNGEDTWVQLSSGGSGGGGGDSDIYLPIPIEELDDLLI